MAAPTRYDGIQAGPPLDITFNPIEKQAFHWFKVEPGEICMNKRVLLHLLRKRSNAANILEKQLKRMECNSNTNE